MNLLFYGVHFAGQYLLLGILLQLVMLNNLYMGYACFCTLFITLTELYPFFKRIFAFNMLYSLYNFIGSGQHTQSPVYWEAA
jgi:hypothetical protein